MAKRKKKLQAKADVATEEVVVSEPVNDNEQIHENSVLEESTKEKAIIKLSKMGVKMGYPDKVEEIYNKLNFNEEDSLFDIVQSLEKIKILN